MRPSRPSTSASCPAKWRATSKSWPESKAQLQSTERALDAARQQKLYMESLLQQYQSRASQEGSEIGGVLGDPTGTTSDALDKEILTLQLRLQDLQSRYTESHPDVVALKEKIAEAEKLKKSGGDEAVGNSKNGNDGKSCGSRERKTTAQFITLDDAATKPAQGQSA